MRAVTRLIRFTIQRHGLTELKDYKTSTESLQAKLLPVVPSWSERAVYMVAQGHISPQSLVGKIVIGQPLAVGERMKLVRIRLCSERRERFLAEQGLAV